MQLTIPLALFLLSSFTSALPSPQSQGQMAPVAAPNSVVSASTAAPTETSSNNSSTDTNTNTTMANADTPFGSPDDLVAAVSAIADELDSLLGPSNATNGNGNGTDGLGGLGGLLNDFTSGGSYRHHRGGRRKHHDNGTEKGQIVELDFSPDGNETAIIYNATCADHECNTTFVSNTTVPAMGSWLGPSLLQNSTGSGYSAASGSLGYGPVSTGSPTAGGVAPNQAGGAGGTVGGSQVGFTGPKAKRMEVRAKKVKEAQGKRAHWFSV